MESRNNCLLCGGELVYLKQAEELTCAYCGKSFESYARCSEGHFVCDACHSLGANELILNYCLETEKSNPLQMALELMRHPAVKMHGPEHHFLVPAVLLTATLNATGHSNEKQAMIEEAYKRAQKVPGGFCGFYGNCGAAVGAGIFVSVLTGATPLSKKEWRLANMMTAQSLTAIAAHGGPRCCKRNTLLALQEAARFLDEQMSIHLDMKKQIVCGFSPLNKECLLAECPFHPSESIQKSDL